MHPIRQPAVAGAFYPGLARILADDVTALLSAAYSPLGKKLPKAIIVPHAGYIYSGGTAAHAYSTLVAGRGQISRVVLLGPVHRVPVRGLALPDTEVFATPLGNIPIDQEAVALLGGLPQITTSAAAHAQEHSLEVQLPFLQVVLGHFALVPLAVGDATASEVAEVLDVLWGGPETLIVVSSDLSHFLPYEIAQAVDQQTAQRILELHGPISHEQACGGTPINGLLLAARCHNLHPYLLDIHNSGDTAGNKERVVGYAAFVFMEERDEH